MRSLTIVVALAVTLLAIAPSRADSPSPETLAAARELVAAIKATDNFKAILPTLMQTMKPAIVQGRPAVEKDYDAILPMMMDIATSHLSEVAELMAQVYARNFTVDELHDLQAFYRTPTGQKLTQVMPVIAQQSMLVGQQWGKSLTAELRARITDELRKRGHDI
jgi:hypothetical protein